jgi:uncharacterized protein YegL
MPFYLLCDASLSMTHDMAALNGGIRRLRAAIVAEPDLDDVAQVCVVTFSDTRSVVVPLGQASELQLPNLANEGGTDYGAARRELARATEADLTSLKGSGCNPFRPCAFFLSDGEPNDLDGQ